MPTLLLLPDAVGKVPPLLLVGVLSTGEPLPLLAEALLTALVTAPVSWNLRAVGLLGSWTALPGWERPRLSCQV